MHAYGFVSEEYVIGRMVMVAYSHNHEAYGRGGDRPRLAFVLGRIALIFQNLFAYYKLSS